MGSRVLLIIFFISISVFSKVNCRRNPIFCQMIKSFENAKKLGLVNKNHKVDRKKIFKTSNLIYKYSKKYKINAKIYTAILFQESKYDLKARNCTKGLIEESEQSISNQCLIKFSYNHIRNHVVRKLAQREYEECVRDFPKYREVRVCGDYGISQINYRTARKKKYRFDIRKLTTDLEYSVECGAIVLKDFKKWYERREPIDWWTRYNTPTRYKRDKYRKDVERWME